MYEECCQISKVREWKCHMEMELSSMCIICQVSNGEKSVTVTWKQSTIEPDKILALGKMWFRCKKLLDGWTDGSNGGREEKVIRIVLMLVDCQWKL